MGKMPIAWGVASSINVAFYFGSLNPTNSIGW